MAQFKFFIHAFLLFITFPLCAQNWFQTEIEGEWQTIEDRMKPENHHVPGMGYVVIRNLAIDTVMYKGFRDRENELLVDENTLFQMGSMTAATVKFAIIRLVNDGKIDLDAPANQYLKSWKIPEKSFTKSNPVTVRDLLTQRRGFNDVYKPKGYLKGESLPTTLQILNGESPSNLGDMMLKKDINKKGNTSIANNMILQVILEDIHGKPLAEVIDSEVFKPLGMNRSLIRAQLSESEKDNYAVGYSQENGERIEGDNRVHPELAAAGLWSTPEDYAKFIIHLYKAAKGLDNSLINKGLAQQSVQPETGYISLVLYQNENKNNYWGGAPVGFYSQFEGNHEEGWAVIACTNKHLSWKFVNWELLPRGRDWAMRDMSKMASK